jgi:peptide/nickel transport system permease protein
MYMLLVLVVLSVVVFIIIQLPPGDYATAYMEQLRMRGGGDIDEEQIETIRHRYGLDVPLPGRYWRWISGFVQGDFGWSFSSNRPIKELLSERLPLTVVLSMFATILTYLISVPIGIYSATHQYSLSDYIVTVIGFIGISVPDFLLALIVMFGLYELFGISAGGLFSSEYVGEVWSWGKVFDLFRHIWTPVIVISLSGTAGLTRVIRAILLDELQKPYVHVARSKGLRETRLLLKYPVRIAMNPILSTIGWTLPAVFSGATIVSMVLSLPTVGPLLLNALMSEDFYVAGDVVMFLSILTIIGTFISDLLLAWADPRIRYE